MALTDRIESLKLRHRDLDAQISRLSSEPSSDDKELTSLKRQKLQLRDEISRLESEGSAAA